jgi:tetratricopeptide (TPR) repeat protein
MFLYPCSFIIGAVNDPGTKFAARAKPGAVAKPPVYIPVTAADVERERRQKIFKWLAVALVVIAAGGLVYKRVTDPRNAREAFDAGLRLMKASRYDQAILNFNRAVDLEPAFAEAFRMRARTYMAQSNLDEAIRDFTRVSVLKPRDALALAERGFASLEKKDYASAIADADRAIALDPKLAKAYNLRGVAHRSVGDPRKAVDDFTKALERDPNLDNYFQRAATYQQLGQHELAIADFTSALEEDPQEPHTYFARAESRSAVGDAAGARADIATGRKIDGW